MAPTAAGRRGLEKDTVRYLLGKKDQTGAPEQKRLKKRGRVNPKVSGRSHVGEALPLRWEEYPSEPETSCCCGDGQPDERQLQVGGDDKTYTCVYTGTKYLNLAT